MNVLYQSIFELFEYHINHGIKHLTTPDDVVYFINECITELESDPFTNITVTKRFYNSYLENKKINIDDLRESLSPGNMKTIIEYCKRVWFISENITSDVTFEDILEYYYIAHMYFYKHIFIKCLSIYINE